jgi:uncharacterized protein YyaL (SSP411 family)
MPSIWEWLLHYHRWAHNTQAGDMVALTLLQISHGGIYDQLGGGFARYSVDHKWFAPHFEKMLYDNAQLVGLYARAHRANAHPRFVEIMDETMAWLNREMRHPDGGYYSALDADTDGEEGLFYTWTAEEIKAVLGTRSNLFLNYYQVSDAGNWEHHRNILYPLGGPHHSLTPEQHQELASAREAMLKERNKRTRPGLDDKILTGWNALLISGMCEAYNSLGQEKYLKEAKGIASFVEQHLMEGHQCFRSFKKKRSQTRGFLEDYAHVIQAWLNLYACTFDESWVQKAAGICEYVIQEFRDPADGYFYFTSSSGEQLISRKKDLFDNVLPSPNSVMARNLFRLGTLLDREEWKQDAIEMVSGVRSLIGKEPAYMSNWAIAALEVTTSTYEIVISGPQAEDYRKKLAATSLPQAILMGASKNSTLPLTRDKVSTSETLIHICVNKTCRRPVSTVADALQSLTSEPT